MLADLKRRFPFVVNSAYAAATAGSAVLGLLLLVLAGRYLPTADYGRFSYALALTTILETIMDLGLGQVTVRAIARDRTGAVQLFRNVLGLKLSWVAVGLAVLGVVAPLLRSDPVVIHICYLMGLSSAVRSYLLTTRGLLQALDRFDIEAFVVVCDRVLLLVVCAAVLMTGHGLYALALAFVGCRLAILIVFLGVARHFLGSIAPRFDRATWRELQAAALPLGFFMIVLNMYTYIDAVILGGMRSNDEVAWYGAAYRLYEGLTYVPSFLAAVLTPRLSHLYLANRPEHRRLFTRVLAASVLSGLVLGAVAFALARPIITTIFGAQYSPGAAPLQILAAGAVFVFATWILHAAAISTNLDRRLLLTTVIGFTTNVALNFLLIPSMGTSGAAWATVIAEALTVVLLFVQVRRRLAA